MLLYQSLVAVKMRIAIFLLGQLVLVVGFWWTLTRLRSHGLLATAWGLVAGCSYLYLFVYYGPTSIAIVLDQSEIARALPWFRNELALDQSLLAGLIQQLFPVLLTSFFLRIKTRRAWSPWTRMEPLLGHPASLWFAILGSLNQCVMAMFYGPMWISRQFVFADFAIWEKILASTFLIFTFTPQIALILYAKYAKSDNSSLLSARMIKPLVMASFAAAFWAFSAFSFRTYSIVAALLFLLWIASEFRLKRRHLFVLFPTVLFILYTTATLQGRMKGEGSLLSISQSSLEYLGRDLAYRSGFGTDSAVIGARTCIEKKLEASRLGNSDILLMEAVSGLPASARRLIYPKLGIQKLEALVGSCYGDWLQRQDLRVDLLDVKNEYFFAFLNPYAGAFLGSVLWSLAGLGLVLLIAWFYRLGIGVSAYMVPASIQVLTFASTPGEFFVFCKAGLPLGVIIFAILALHRSKVSRDVHAR